MSQPRIVFAGTPAFAADHLAALISANHNIVAVYTQPDRPAKRGKKLMASPVKTLALEHGLHVEQPLNFKEAGAVDTLAAYQADILVVVAYGLILPQAVLDLPTIAPINVHASLLPRWRGAAPIERAIEAGDSETGVGIMVMEAGLDTGPVINEARCNITTGETGDSLREKLSEIGCKALLNSIQQLVEKGVQATPQAEEGVTYAHKLQRHETALNWQQPAHELLNKIHAFNSANVTTLDIGDKRVKVWLAEASNEAKAEAGAIVSHSGKKIHIACGDGVIALTQLQMPGGKTLASRDILNGQAALFAVGNTVALGNETS